MILALLLALGFGAPRHTQAPAYSLAWSYTSPASKLAAVANGGVFVDALGLVTFHGTVTATPVWQAAPPMIAFQPRADASGNTLATFQLEQASPTAQRFPVLRRYQPASGTPLWSYSFPFAVQNTASGLHVSKDGSRIVAWAFNYSTMRTVVTTFASGSGQQISTALIQTYGEPRASALSEDGTRLLIVSALVRARVQTNSGGVTTGFNTVQVGTDCAISPDGSRFAVARSRGTVDVWNEEAQQAPINGSSATVACMEMRYGPDLVIAWDDGLVQAGAVRFDAPAPLRDMEIDGNRIATVGDALATFERSGSSWVKSFEQASLGANDVDMAGDLVSVVTGTRVDLLRRGSAPMPQIEYRVAIPKASAVPGSTHTVPGVDVATGQPAGGSITVRVE